MNNTERTALYYALWAWSGTVSRRYGCIDFDTRYRAAMATAFGDYGYQRGA